MKVYRKPLKKGRVELIPMIDSMLILLIFYMSFSTFAEMEMEYGVKLPTASESSKWKKVPDQLIVNFRQNGEMLVNKQLQSNEELDKMVGDYYKANPKISIVIRADRKLYYKEINKILSMCARNGISNITFATLESE